MKTELKVCIQLILWISIGQARQDVAAGRSPSSQKNSLSELDANLMFEILLYGVDVDQDNNIVLLEKELASMRSGRDFLSQINDNIPRSLSSMVQMVTTLKDEKRKPLTRPQFESLVFGVVYSAHRAWQARDEEREAWGEVLLQLANVTVHELRGSSLFLYV